MQKNYVNAFICICTSVSYSEGSNVLESLSKARRLLIHMALSP